MSISSLGLRVRFRWSGSPTVVSFSSGWVEIGLPLQSFLLTGLPLHAQARGFNSFFIAKI